MNDLDRYYKEALLDGLCGEYKGRWASCHGDKEKLVRLVMAQQSLPHFISYCHQGRGLGKEFILEEFKNFINGKYTGIDVDGVEGNYKTSLNVAENAIFKLSDDVSAFMWSTIPSLQIEGCKATKLYVGCSSEVHLVCDGYNSVTVMLFDDSVLYLDDVDEESSVTVYKYSDESRVEIGRFCLSQKVHQFRKELKL